MNRCEMTGLDRDTLGVPYEELDVDQLNGLKNYYHSLPSLQTDGRPDYGKYKETIAKIQAEIDSRE